MRLVRFHNRLNVDELLSPILNLEILDMFPDTTQMSVVPEKFESSAEYFMVWQQLFLYETYNQLIN
jgi:hypothetical protein